MDRIVNDLQTRIQRALVDNPRTKDYGVEILDSNGVVTLRGTVPSYEARDLVEEVVRGVDGVVSVTNEIDVVK